MRYLSLLFFVLLAGCASTPEQQRAWQEFNAAKHQLIVTHRPLVVENCEKRGAVHGRAYDDILSAKDDAEDQAVHKGGNHLLYTDFWSEPIFFPWFFEQELFHAEGLAYYCSE